MEKRWTREIFERMDKTEKQAMMQELASRYDMEFKGLHTFSRWGKGIVTGVFEKDESEFVFVPADTLTLGWDAKGQELDAPVREEIQETLDLYGMKESAEEFLNQMTSPVRQVTVGPMVVECRQREIGWEYVKSDDVRVTGNSRWMEFFEKYKGEGGQQLNIVGQVRFTRAGEGWNVALYQKITYQELLQELEQNGFSLPTEDEWEYLCGGGCRTLFPWGNTIPDDMHLRYFEKRGQKKKAYTLEEPNFFGLVIGFDPYRQEIVQKEEKKEEQEEKKEEHEEKNESGKSGMYKGGDGGCNVCGGMGPVMGYLPCSPYARMEEMEDEEELQEDWELNNDFDFCRRIIRVEEAN